MLAGFSNGDDDNDVFAFPVAGSRAGGDTGRWGPLGPMDNSRPPEDTGAFLPGGGGGGGGGDGIPHYKSGSNYTQAIADDREDNNAWGAGGQPGYGGGFFGSFGGGGQSKPKNQVAGNNSFGTFFERGGAIPEGDENPMLNQSGSDLSAQIATAKGIVNSVLQYGRAQYGFGQQQAGIRTPMVPGNPSESGKPREQPAPGPLPPTSNPFGKRAEAEQEPEQEEAPQQVAGAIDTDDDEAV